VRFTVEDRALLRRLAELEGVTEAALVVAVVSADLAKRARRLKRLERAAAREQKKLGAAAKDRRQIPLFDFEGGT
jgi:hypothetical protein